ncbi:MAG: CoA pyrophosphatase [Candidatus Nanopelagicales bacterium]|nr:CoA pyrophosphatase [Candidatus Nanopelagicales bacterium]MDZ4248665.1 CoA pyrophosphatase [Candidatus Nanopelagicales bacterium]
MNDPWLDETVVSALPDWLSDMVEAVRGITADKLTRFLPPASGGRPGAVLILLGESGGRPDVLLTERSPTMRSHPGQPAFPGGAVDDADPDAVAAALREAAEETGLDPRGVVVFGTLPELWLPPSGFVVTPVMAWWSTPTPVGTGNPAEVSAVHRVGIAELADPDNRVLVRHPLGFEGPGFQVRGMLVWGFTAGLLSKLMEEAGWARPWDPTRVVAL